MSIAGSDSGGGAGVQVDVRTFFAHGVFGTTAIAAVTVQNTVEVRDVIPISPESVAAQMEAVLDDMPVAAAKTGMLAGSSTVVAVAAVCARRSLGNLVVDPVLVSSTGLPLSGNGSVEAYRDHLLPVALVATPNLFEASVLTGGDVGTPSQMAEAAAEIHSWGVPFVLVKGGHLAGDQAVDIFFDGITAETLSAPRIDTANVHGTGCTLSASIAARLARGEDVRAAIAGAKRYVHGCISAAAGWSLGRGHGPLDHAGGAPEPFAP